MRRSLSKLTALATALLFGVFMAACEGAQGPAGEDGADGTNGTNGVDGVDGQDANQNCIQCHFNDTELLAKQLQYLNSFHYTGGDFERSTTSCAPCHTHEGFIETRIVNDPPTQVTAADVVDPTPPNCRTCHMIHTTYTDADYAFTTSSAVALWYPDTETVDFGTGNLCANCHQARIPSPIPVLGAGIITVGSDRFGTHHSPVATTLGGGDGLIPFTGTMTVPAGPNTHGNVAVNADGCITCHGGTAFGDQAGGHTWAMEYEYHGGPVDNVAGCNQSGCHSNETSFDINGVQTDFDTNIETLRALLETHCIYDPSNGRNFEGDFDSDIVAAYLNWQILSEDKSHAVHNPPRIEAILANTIETLQALAVPVCPPPAP
jgi:hypothetical protein